MNETTPTTTTLFPEIVPFATHNVPVGDGHTLYVVQYGNPQGIPVVVLHGGPGSGLGDKAPRRFNPALYHIIGFDQRGAGRSTPVGSLVANTTAHLVQDIEILRSYLNIESWAVYGSSWGSTLALAYAQTHPDKVRALAVGGVFLGTEEEIAWFNHPGGLARLLPLEYENLRNLFPTRPTGPALDKAVFAALTGTDTLFAKRAAEAFAMYESMACTPAPDAAAIRDHIAADPALVAHIAIELYYFVNNCFLAPGQLLENYARISQIPLWIFQGTLDLVCPPVTAHRLKAVLPHAQLILAHGGGHYSDPALEAARVQATNAMAAALSA